MALGERQITVDCDVIQADGGTRCAAITGGWVALRLAVQKPDEARGRDQRPDDRPGRGGQSCGIYAGQPVLDLDYPEDSEAGVDGNFIMTRSGRLIEVQMSAEGATFSARPDGPVLDLAEKGVQANSPRRNGRRSMRRFDGRHAAGGHAQHRQAGRDRSLLDALWRHVCGAAERGWMSRRKRRTTFAGNARIKAHAAARATGLPALSDDSAAS